MMRAVALAALIFAPVGAAAQSAPVPATDYDDRIVEACLAQHWGNQNAQESCVGIAARACMPPGEGDAAVAIACFDAEREQWDGRLTTVLDTLRLQFAPADDRAEDVAPQDTASPDLAQENAPPETAPADPSQDSADPLVALETAQAAWLLWRDALCDLDAARYPGSPIGQTARAECLMRLTARQSFDLSARLDGSP